MCGVLKQDSHISELGEPSASTLPREGEGRVGKLEVPCDPAGVPETEFFCDETCRCSETVGSVAW